MRDRTELRSRYGERAEKAMWGKRLVLRGRAGHASISILGGRRSRTGRRMSEVQEALLCLRSRVAVSSWRAGVGTRSCCHQIWRWPSRTSRHWTVLSCMPFLTRSPPLRRARFSSQGVNNLSVQAMDGWIDEWMHGAITKDPNETGVNGQSSPAQHSKVQSRTALGRRALDRTDLRGRKPSA